MEKDLFFLNPPEVGNFCSRRDACERATTADSRSENRYRGGGSSSRKKILECTKLTKFFPCVFNPPNFSARNQIFPKQFLRRRSMFFRFSMVFKKTKIFRLLTFSSSESPARGSRQSQFDGEKIKKTPLIPTVVIALSLIWESALLPPHLGHPSARYFFTCARALVTPRLSKWKPVNFVLE